MGRCLARRRRAPSTANFDPGSMSGAGAETFNPAERSPRPAALREMRLAKHGRRAALRSRLWRSRRSRCQLRCRGENTRSLTLLARAVDPRQREPAPGQAHGPLAGSVCLLHEPPIPSHGEGSHSRCVRIPAWRDVRSPSPSSPTIAVLGRAQGGLAVRIAGPQEAHGNPGQGRLVPGTQPRRGNGSPRASIAPMNGSDELDGWGVAVAAGVGDGLTSGMPLAAGRQARPLKGTTLLRKELAPIATMRRGAERQDDQRCGNRSRLQLRNFRPIARGHRAGRSREPRRSRVAATRGRSLLTDPGHPEPRRRRPGASRRESGSTSMRSLMRFALPGWHRLARRHRELSAAPARRSAIATPGPDRHADDLGDLELARRALEVTEHEDGCVVGTRQAERSLELVAIDDRPDAVLLGGVGIGRQQLGDRDPAFPARSGHARPNDHAIAQASNFSGSRSLGSSSQIVIRVCCRASSARW